MADRPPPGVNHTAVARPTPGIGSARFMILALLAAFLALLLVTALALRCYTKLRKHRKRRRAKDAAAAAGSLNSSLEDTLWSAAAAAGGGGGNTHSLVRYGGSREDRRAEKGEPEERTRLMSEGGDLPRHASAANRLNSLSVPGGVGSGGGGGSGSLSFNDELSHSAEVLRRASMMSQSSRRRGSYMFVHKDSLTSLHALSQVSGKTQSSDRKPSIQLQKINSTDENGDDPSSAESAAGERKESDQSRTMPPVTPAIFQIGCSNPDLCQPAAALNEPTLLYQPPAQSTSASQQSLRPPQSPAAAASSRGQRALLSQSSGALPRSAKSPSDARNLRGLQYATHYAHNNISRSISPLFPCKPRCPCEQCRRYSERPGPPADDLFGLLSSPPYLLLMRSWLGSDWTRREGAELLRPLNLFSIMRGLSTSAFYPHQQPRTKLHHVDRHFLSILKSIRTTRL